MNKYIQTFDEFLNEGFKDSIYRAKSSVNRFGRQLMGGPMEVKFDSQEQEDNFKDSMSGVAPSFVEMILDLLNNRIDLATKKGRNKYIFNYEESRFNKFKGGITFNDLDEVKSKLESEGYNVELDTDNGIMSISW